MKILILISIKAYGYQNGKVNSKNFVGEAITDQNGNFKFASDTDIYGDYLVQFKAQNTHKGTNTWCKLHLDRWLTPVLLPFMEDMMTIHPYNNNEQQSSINRPDNQKVKYFEWTDTILPYKVSNLKAATIHAKRKYKGFTGTRYTWNGGVDNGIHASLTYYNIKRECERFRDFGINDLNLFSFLKIVDLKCKYNDIKDVNGIGNSMKRLSLGDIYFNSSEDYKFDSSNNFERNAANFNETDIEIPSSFNFGEKPKISLRYKKKVYLINNHPYALLLNNEETDDFFDEENNILCKDFEAVTIVRYEEFADNLSGKYKISYSISLRMDGRESDRLADMNCFWAASDPLHPDSLFFRSEERHGIFKNYNSLNLYYVGYGGNDNTTTRFRKYHGKFYGTEDDNRVKPLLQEYTDEKHLLKPNNWYNVVITVQDGVSQFSVNGEELFRLEDKEPYEKGYFGIRLLENRAQITAFSVEKL